MANKDFTLHGTMTLDIAGITSSLSKVQQTLSKIDLKPNLRTSFETTFSNLTSELEKFQSKLNSGFKTKGDVTGLEASATKIRTIFAQLEKNMAQVQGLDLSKILKLDSSQTAQLQAINKQIKELQANLQTISTAKIDEVRNALSKLQNEGAKKAGGQILQLFDAGEFQQAELALKNLIAAQERYISQAESQGKSTTRLVANKEVLQSLIPLFEQATNSSQGLNNELDNLNTSKAQVLTDAISKLNSEVSEGSTEIKDLGNATNKTTSDMVGMAQATQRANSELDQVKNRVANFFSLANSVDLFRKAINNAFTAVKELDASMTEIAVVTDFSVGDMWEKIPEYTQMANELGATTVGAYDTAKLYYQQGLDTNEVMAASAETMKMARIANMDYSTATDYMTAAIRGFKLEMTDTTRVNDVFSELAAKTAADTQEIAEALTKTASIANSAGMSLETTSAFLTQMIETTREAPENLGTAMKTIIARFQELKKAPDEIGLIDGEIVDANKIETALRTVGITLRDEVTGQFRELDSVFIELAGKWDTLDKNTQRYIATTAAGSRQQSRFIAMMDNYERTMELIGYANNNAGASQEQFNKTLDSLQSKLNLLENAWREFTTGITNSTLIKGAIDLITSLLTGINNLTKGMGDVPGAIAKIGIALGGLKLGKGLFDKLFTSLGKSFFKGGQESSEEFGRGLEKNLTKVSLKTRTWAKVINNQLKQNFQQDGQTFEGIAKSFEKVPAEIQREISRKMPQIGKSFVNDFKNSINYSSLEGDARIAADRIINGFNNELMSGDFSAGIKKLQDGAKDFNVDFKPSNNSIKTLTSSMSQLGSAVGNVGSLFNNLASTLDGLGLNKIAGIVRDIGSAFTALGGILSTIGAIVAALGWKVTLIIGIVAAVVGGIAALFNSFHSQSIAGQLEKAEESADAAKEAADAASQSVDDLLSARDSYNDLQKQLDNLIEGTLEYKQILLEANQQVLELINKYPELAKVATAINGRLILPDEGYEEVIQEYQKSQLNAQMWQSSANARVDSLTAEKDNSELRKDISSNTFVNTYVVQQSTGPNGEIYENGGPRDFLTDKNISDLSKAIAKDNSLLIGTEEEINADFYKAVEEIIASDLAPNESIPELHMGMLVEALWANRDALLENGLSIENASTQEEALHGALLNFQFSDNESIQDSGRAKVITDVLSSNLSDRIESKYNDYANSTASNGKPDDDVRKEWAEMMKASGFTYKDGKVLDSSGEEYKKIDVSEMKRQLATRDATEEAEKNGEKLALTLSKIDTNLQKSFGEKNLLDKIIMEDTTVDSKALSNFLSNTEKMEEVVQNYEQFGFDSAEAFENSIRESSKNIQKIQAQQQKNVAKMFKKTTKEGISDKQIAMLMSELTQDQLTYLEQFGKTIQSQIGDAGLTEFMAGMTDIYTSGTQEEIENAENLIKSIDWDNPIDAVDQLKSALDDAYPSTQALAAALLDAGKDAYGAGEQFQYFIKSADYQGLTEQIEDFIEENGKITPENVKELTKSSSNLGKMLSNTEMSASGMAKALTGLHTGVLTIDDLTDSVLVALSSFDQLDEVILNAFDTMENFNPGLDEGEIGEWVNGIKDTVTELYENGEYGNSQLQNYLKLLFGEDEWNKALSNANGNLQKAEGTLINRLSVLEGNLYGAWEDLAKNYQDGLKKFNESSGTNIEIFKNKDGSIQLNTNGATTEQVVNSLMSAYNVSKEYAEMMLTDFKNFSTDLQTELAANDFASGLNKYIQERTITTGKKVDSEATKQTGETVIQEEKQAIFTDKEIRAISSATGKQEIDIWRGIANEMGITVKEADNLASIQQKISQQGAVLQLLDSQGNLKSIEDLSSELNSKLGAGASWIEGFKVNGSIAIEDLQSMLSSLGIPEGQIASMIQHEIEMSEEGTVFTFEGAEVPKEDIINDYSAAIEQAQKEADASILADQIVEALASPDFSGTASNLEDSFISSYGTIKDGISTAISEGGSAGATSAQTSIDGLHGKTIDITPRLTSTTVTGSANGATVTLSMRAKGSSGLKKKETALVGEEGAELVEKQDGTAELVGINGPIVTDLDKGDIIHTAEETEDILNGKEFKNIKRYATGYTNKKSQTSGSSKKSNSKSSSSKDNSKEEEPWENPYDWLYNLTEDINENLREREKLERRYDRILRDRKKTAKDLYDNIKAQTENLKEQERLQEQMLSKRRQEMTDFLADNSDLSKYGTFNWGDNTIEINWDLINSVKDSDEGEAIEEYISKLEEIQDNMDDAEDAFDEIVDQIYELQQIGKDEFDDLESRTLDALIQRDQEAIDKLSNINDSINNANQKLLDSVQRNLDQIRQDRQNEETEQNLAEKERQLAYLRQDTSGANAMQIRQLEEELANEQESYTDTLIDQRISELQQQNDEAAEQRERQIELAQAQLEYAQENGLYWQEAHKIMQDGVNAAGALIKGSELVQILGSAEGWDAMSEIQQMNWLSQLEETSKQALQYFSQQRQLETIGKTSGNITFTNANGQTLTGTVQSDGSVKVSTGSGTYTYKDVYQNYDGTYRTLEGQSDASYTANRPAPAPAPSPSPSASYYRATPYRGYSIVDGLKAIGEYTASEYKNRKKIAAANGIKNYTGSASQNTQMLRLLQQGKLKRYAKGGLVDTTGLAWLDGTSSNPEMVLRSKDTENFIELKNILAEILKGKENSISERSGDNYFEIHIEVDSLGSDYDTEQLADKIKRMINEDARYRNVNAINILR